MNRLTIDDLEVFYRIGVTKQERLHPQRLLLTIAMYGSFTQAATTDDLEDTIDYAALSSQLLQFGTDREWMLIERLAHEIASMILQDHHPEEVRVTIKKFVIPQANQVTFQLRLKRESINGSKDL